MSDHPEELTLEEQLEELDRQPVRVPVAFHPFQEWVKPSDLAALPDEITVRYGDRTIVFQRDPVFEEFATRCQDCGRWFMLRSIGGRPSHKLALDSDRLTIGGLVACTCGWRVRVTNGIALEAT